MKYLHLLAFVLASFLTTPFVFSESPVAVETGDRIVIIGNTLAERMQFGGDFESLVQSRFPGMQLVVRNLGWSADEIDLRPRSANFDDHKHRLADHKPDVVLAMFGLNESFGGAGQLEAFGKRFAAFIAETRKQIGAAELVVFSPIPHEDLGRAELPNGEATNRNLIMYCKVMKQQCDAASLRFIDLFAPLRDAMDAIKEPLTINGIHLNEKGNELLGAAMDRALFGPRPSSTPAEMATLRSAVIEKDKQF